MNLSDFSATFAYNSYSDIATHNLMANRPLFDAQNLQNEWVQWATGILFHIIYRRCFNHSRDDDHSWGVWGTDVHIFDTQNPPIARIAHGDSGPRHPLPQLRRGEDRGQLFRFSMFAFIILKAYQA